MYNEKLIQQLQKLYRVCVKRDDPLERLQNDLKTFWDLKKNSSTSQEL